MARAASNSYALSTVANGSRTVAYSVIGRADGIPVLVFYPAGGNRRMLPQVFRGLQPEEASALRLICVNRPGKGETSPADEPGAAAHVDAACNDILAVLNALDVRAASLAFLCAGTPFALAFASRFPQRVTGNSVGVSPWVLPGDCLASSTLLRAGAKLPTWMVCPLVGGSMGAGASLGSMPTGMAASLFKSNFSAREKELLTNLYPDSTALMEGIADISSESGGEAVDVEVCLSKASALGIDYNALQGSRLIWGELDNLVSGSSVDWLAQQMSAASVQRVPESTHNGTILLFDPDISRAFSSLRRPVAVA